MSDQEQIATIRQQTLARIAEITSAPKPSYAIEGQQVAWADYLAQLRQTIDWCDAKLTAASPFEFHSIART